MRFTKWLLIGVFVLCTIALGATSIMADARINVVHHFGGDVLYCNQTEGCWMLNIHGEPLWSVEQSVIDAAVETACASSSEQSIDAGAGTYGEFTLLVRCPNQLFLVGYDEWSKQNVMPFLTDYVPVGAGPSSNLCALELTIIGSPLYPGNFAILPADENNVPIFSSIGSVRFSDTDEGLPPCNISSIIPA